MLLDRMVHLFSRGCVIPVVSYVRKCSEQQDTDISLIRYFVTEVSLKSGCGYCKLDLQQFLKRIRN